MEKHYHITLSKIRYKAYKLSNLKRSFEIEKKTHLNSSPNLFNIITILDKEIKDLNKSLKIHNLNFKQFYVNGYVFSITFHFRFSKHWNNLMLWLDKI